MDGGVVHGVGMKGKVMDYQDIHVKGIKKAFIYILDKTIVEKEISIDEIDELLALDKKKEYVVKEFLEPPFPMKLQGYTKKTYLLRELKGFEKILSVMDFGIPYKNTTLFGFEFINDESHCFTITRKCKETLKESTLATMTHPEFKRFVIDILTDLVKIQKKKIAHGDIKLDNIMKCKKYQLIDWENSRPLDYDVLLKQRYLGLSPMYFQLLYGAAWYPTFSVALLKYYRETGRYDSKYATQLISHFSSLFQKYTPKTVFEKTKYTLDVGAFGFILYGAMNNPVIQRYQSFIMNMYKMSAKEALDTFQKNKTRKRT